jgi:phosphotransferase system HPr (HPr) family protein
MSPDPSSGTPSERGRAEPPSVEARGKVKLVNSRGLHARPCHALVSLALRFQSDLVVRCHGQEVNGKSILELMTLTAAFGNQLEFRARGADAQALVAGLVSLVESGFSETD